MVDINTEEVFKKLKKQHGETFAKIMRGDEDHNGDLCAIPNILHILEFAGHNPDEARQLRKVILEIYSSKDKAIKTIHKTDKDPLQLLSDAGYDAFVVETEQQKNSIIGYYRANERLCTFADSNRHKNYYMIHAIKKEVLGDDKLPENEWHIKPSDHPQRQDEYGTSVISIQIARTGGFISIKNRYNHSVANPDATFNNNPDNIISGLSYALKKHFKVDFKTTKTPLPDNFRMVNDQLVRFNYEKNNIYFGSDYYFSGSTITKLKDDGSQLLFYHGFMLDMSHNNSRIVSIAGEEQEFCEALNKYIQGKKIKVTGAKGSTKSILLNGERFMDIVDGRITFINAPTIVYMPLLKTINPELGTSGLSGEQDFSNVDYLNLEHVNLGDVTGVKLNPKATAIITAGLKLSGDLDFSGVKFLNIGYSVNDGWYGDLLNNVTGIKFNPNADTIKLGIGLKLSGNLDFSGVRFLDMEHVNLKNVTGIKFNPNADVIVAGYGLELSGDLDFSGVRFLDTEHVNLKNVTGIKFNPNANTIKVGCSLKLSGNLDFSGVRHLKLGTDIGLVDSTNVTGVKCGTADTVELNVTALSGNLDFSRVQSLTINGRSKFCRSGYADLTNVTGIKFNPSGRAYLSYVKLSGNLDFSNLHDVPYINNSDLTNVTGIKLNSEQSINFYEDILPRNLNIDGGDFIQLSETKLRITSMAFNNVKQVNLKWSDLTNVINIKFGNTQDVNLDGAKLSGDLDFSKVKRLSLNNADLSKVSSIKFNPNGEVFGLSPKDKLKFTLINGINVIKRIMPKVKSVTKKSQRTM